MTDTKTLWIFSGETSGDLYGAQLATEAKTIMPELRIAGMGGPEMKKAGVDILVDSTELGVVGIVEIFGQFFEFVRIFRKLEKLALKEKPSAVVLIDYPGFNLRFAASMYRKGIPVIWYVSPQVWAWKKGRIHQLAKYCSKMLVIFPFEPETYEGTGLDTEFVGHPLVEVVHARKDPSITRDLQRVLLLPGSRFNEINRLLLPMLETAFKLHKKHPGLTFAISAPREKVFKRINDIYQEFCNAHQGDDLPVIDITCGETSRWLQEAGTGLAASGTITVECAIAELPLVVVYKLHPVTLMVARMLVTLFRGFFTMVNIIANRVVFEEFIQHFVHPDNLVPAMEKILPGGERRETVEKDMREVVDALSVGSTGASRKAAEACVNFIRNEMNQRQE